MFLREVVEEIIEKSSNELSPKSIIRKVTQVRNRLMRNYGSLQERETIASGVDLIKGQPLYFLPCSAGSVIDVDILVDRYSGRYRRLRHRQFNEIAREPYYYFVEGKIGIIPVPTEDVPVGLKIFHIPELPPLTVEDMDGPTGFDPDFDMLLVYGVLREISSDESFDFRYHQILDEYKAASSGFSGYVVTEVW